MNLYLLRHGIAEEQSNSGRDEDRELTDEGRERLTNLLHRAAHSGVKPDVILTSPYKRALQTAKLAVKHLDGPAPIVTNTLVPYAAPAALWAELRDHAEANQLLVASHEPFLSQAASFLLGSPALKIDMKKGALVSIAFDSLRGEPRGVLQWMLIPRLCA